MPERAVCPGQAANRQYAAGGNHRGIIQHKSDFANQCYLTGGECQQLPFIGFRDGVGMETRDNAEGTVAGQPASERVRVRHPVADYRG